MRDLVPVRRDRDADAECERDAREWVARYGHLLTETDDDWEEAEREHALRCDLRRTFGLPGDTPTTDLF